MLIYNSNIFIFIPPQLYAFYMFFSGGRAHEGKSTQHPQKSQRDPASAHSVVGQLCVSGCG